MQKIFRKYTVFITMAAILTILVIHYNLTLYLLESQQLNTFHTKINQIIHTLKHNQTELDSIKNNLDEDYLTRAKVAEYLLRNNKELTGTPSELQDIASLLDVDELHIIDENGIISHSSNLKYVGLDFHDNEQTRAFLSILEDGSESSYVIQEAQPNASEHQMMKYVGVARKDTKGIVQVGLKPIRELQAQARNTYNYIFSKFPTDIGEEIFAINCDTGQIIGHSDGAVYDNMREYYQVERLQGCENGCYQKMQNGCIKYIVTRQYGNILIGAAIPKNTLYSNLWKNVLTTFIYLLLIEIIIIILLNYLVKRKVVDGIHGILESLSEITHGNLSTTVAVSGNPEFLELSNGINTMVKGITSAADRTSKIIGMSGIPLAAFEYQSSMKHVFMTPGLQELLNLSVQDISRFQENPDLFCQTIQEIMKQPILGENDIFEIDSEKYVHIHFSIDSDGYMGVISDVTKDVMEKRRILYENSHDQLTRLYKYKYFKQLASDILTQMPEENICAFVMLDLDSFKKINDTYGHDVGDKYLQHFASIMQAMPQEHYLTARRSGDEFCMMIFGCSKKEDITHLLQIFFSELENNKIELSSHQLKAIKASAGFSCTEKTDADITILLRQADEALYNAKRENKGYFAEYTI